RVPVIPIPRNDGGKVAIPLLVDSGGRHDGAARRGGLGGEPGGVVSALHRRTRPVTPEPAAGIVAGADRPERRRGQLDRRRRPAEPGALARLVSAGRAGGGAAPGTGSRRSGHSGTVDAGAAGAVTGRSPKRTLPDLR